MKPIHNLTFFFFIFFTHFLQSSHSQQTYVDNKQLNCYRPDNSTNGFLCNGPQTSCRSYLTFRSQPPYDSALSIGYLMNSDPSMIAQLNNITDVEIIPTNTVVIVPVTNCSCSGNYYQHNASYTLKTALETYFTVANNTYQGLTTCQALMNQNPRRGSRNLLVGMRLSLPLRCACPSRNQTANGVKYLLSYLVTWGDTISDISRTFGVDVQSTLDANELAFKSTIYPFTPILVPLKTIPTLTTTTTTTTTTNSPPPFQPPPITTPTEDNGSKSKKSKKKWVFVGIGIGSFSFLVVLLFGFLYLYLGRHNSSQTTLQSKNFSVSNNPTATPGKNSQPGIVSSENVRYMIDSSLNVYNFEELQKATGYFNEDNRIKGSVYLGVIKGDEAAIKRMKGDALNEINVLKQINHSSIIKLSGYCMHEGNAYLVYEFAENGSLSDLLHEDKSDQTPSAKLEWKQRVQIAYDVADGLNYLHNYATPPYIHKDLKSSNILLNSGFRAKIANFGMARTAKEEVEAEDVLQLTRHVVGTQGYMAPEYIENGVITLKLDVFAFGVVILELLSGKEAVTLSDNNGNDGKTGKGGLLLFASINEVLEGDNVREKLRNFIDPSLENEYPLDLAFTMAELAQKCVAHDLASRPTMFDVFVAISKIHSSCLDWDPSDELQRTSMVHA